MEDLNKKVRKEGDNNSSDFENKNITVEGVTRAEWDQE